MRLYHEYTSISRIWVLKNYYGIVFWTKIIIRCRLIILSQTSIKRSENFRGRIKSILSVIKDTFYFLFLGAQQNQPSYQRKSESSSCKKDESKFEDDTMSRQSIKCNLSVSRTNHDNKTCFDQSKSKSLPLYQSNSMKHGRNNITAIQSKSAMLCLNQSGLRMTDTLDQSRARNVSFLLSGKKEIDFLFLCFLLDNSFSWIIKRLLER